MLRNRNGQAKVLTVSEIQQLLNSGFKCSRDKALFAITFYTACRISETRKMHLVDAFHDGVVRDEILIRKENTKGQQGTRTIPTHPHLKKILQEYYDNSLKLIELKKLTGGWSSRSLNADGKISINNDKLCPICQSTWLMKQGFYRRKTQIYLCRNCGSWTRETKVIKKKLDTDTPTTIEYDTLGVICSNLYGFLFDDSLNPYLFPGYKSQGYISLRNAMSIFEQVFDKFGIEGASTHSCRRTALTTMHREGVILRILQEISGHKDLGALQRYLEVSEEQTRAAINVLN
ncbi:MAG: tyrosine-type recombinase/integrase [Nostoc sp. LLA-1]|nr:tyrosine-type recombinase/integrase [Cyanocohniella sp. LLY]